MAAIEQAPFQISDRPTEPELVAHELLRSNAEHVEACRTIDADCSSGR